MSAPHKTAFSGESFAGKKIHFIGIGGSGMSGLIYLLSALILNAIFLYYVVKLYKNYSDKLSMKTFKYSIVYLSLIFSALLLDHYFKISLQF